MLDLGAAGNADSARDPFEGFIAGLCARVPQGSAPARASAEIRRRREAGEKPIGLYRLTEVLASADQSAASAPRQPLDAHDAVVDVVRRFPCALLEAPHPAAIAQNVAAVLADGKRIVVTGMDQRELAAVRAALPAFAQALCLDKPLPLSVAEQRELRTLLATAASSQQERIGQSLPDPQLIPAVELVGELCRAAGRPGFDCQDDVERIPELLGALELSRLSALMDAARRCVDALRLVDNGGSGPSWSRTLLERVLFGPSRSEVEGLQRRCSELVSAAEQLRDAQDNMAVVGTLSPRAVEQLREYAEYLEQGGRFRSYFRSPQQRAVEPVLRQLRLDDASAKDAKQVRQAVALVELVQGLEELANRCRSLGVPPPSDVPGVAELNRQLGLIQNAADQVDELRREVLFLNPSNPFTLSDLATAHRIAVAIVRSGGPAEMAKARRRLADLADALAKSVDPSTAAPECAALIRALHEQDLPAYVDALRALAGAHREKAEQRRRAELLSQVRAAAPELADTWSDRESRGWTFGTARFVPLDELLGQLPPADEVDLVVLLDAGALGRENLLVAAAAPRLIAVATRLDDGASDTVLAALRNAGVPALRAAVPEGSSGEEEAAEIPPGASTTAWQDGQRDGRAAHAAKLDAERTVPVPAQRDAPPAEYTSGRHAARETYPEKADTAEVVNGGPNGVTHGHPTDRVNGRAKSRSRTQAAASAKSARGGSNRTAKRDVGGRAAGRSSDSVNRGRFAVLPLGIVALDAEEEEEDHRAGA